MQPATAFAASFPSTADLLQAWVERDPLPRVLVDEQLRVIWANPAAQDALDRKRDIAIRDGQLSTTQAGEQQALIDFVRGTGSALTSFCFPCEDGDGHLLFRAVEVQRDWGTRYFGLTFFRSGSGFSVRYADLDKVFQLTQSEHRVLLQLLDGLTADQIATKLGVSIETTRSHIRQIYLKLNVTSREGMFSRVLPYRL